MPPKAKTWSVLEDPPEYPLANVWRRMRVGEFIYLYLLQGRAKLQAYMTYNLDSPLTWPEESLTQRVLTDEELINQRQQNDYLEERIRELESRLQEAEEKAVEDADLANMEDRLRVQREAAADDSGGAWYSRPMTWLAAVVVLAAGRYRFGPVTTITASVRRGMIRPMVRGRVSS